MTLLDTLLPRWDARERHRIPLDAAPARALAAVRAATAEEMPLVRVLFRLRGLGRGAATATPVFDRMLAAGFRVLAEDEREVVVGLVGQPWRVRGGIRRDAPFESFDEPGFAKVAVSFSFDGAELATETRVLLTSAAARRRFRLYWAAIRQFSGLIRRSWLRAARRRAES